MTYRYEVNEDYGVCDRPDDEQDVAAWERGDVWSVSIIDNETGELVDFDYPVFGEANAHERGREWIRNEKYETFCHLTPEQ
jgi:hypothetical protein